MSLRKAVFFGVVTAYVASLIAALAMVIGVGFNVVDGRSVDILPVGLTVVVCVVLRLVFSLWLRHLGGVPEEYRKK